MAGPWEKYAPKPGPWTKYAPVADPPGTSVPAMGLPENPELQMRGPGPTGAIDPALYDQGILPRRFMAGAPQAKPPVVAGDGTEMVFNPTTGQYTSRELMAGNMNPSAADAFTAGASQGITFGLGDEVAGMVGSPYLREKGRAAVDAARRDRPGMTLAGELGGAVSLPMPQIGASTTLGQAVKTGAKTGAAYGAGYAAASSDGGAINRLKDGVEGAVAGALFGAAAPVVVNFGTKAFRKLFSETSQRPTIESLREAKTTAYRDVDDAGEVFTPDEMTALAAKVKNGLADSNYVEGVDRQTDAVIALLDRKSSEPIKVGQLDKLRQSFWKRYEAAKNEVGILDAIDAIDELVMSRASTSELLDAARLANGRYKKAELLDLAFQKAEDQTAATGSGGNILNKYRQAVTSIINNPKQAKWFSADEVSAMRSFVEGSTAQNVMRRFGKLAPGGNGLMLALNLGGAANFGAGSLAVTALASGAKAISDGAAQRGAQSLIGRVGGGNVPIQKPPVGYSNRLNVLAGPLSRDRLFP